MILGIGIDTTDIERFTPWTKFATEQLQKVFTLTEIEYSKAVPAKTAERLAGRFAAREAFYKAFTQMLPDHAMPLLGVTKHVCVAPLHNGSSELIIDWKALLGDHVLKIKSSNVFTHLSITHTPTIATAMVIIETR